MALARPHMHAIAAHLCDEDAKCRMAALRALKCMGETASLFQAELKSWQQFWYDLATWEIDRAKTGHKKLPSWCEKLEPITARALLFPYIPLRKLFKGHAPLGNRFGGSKTEQVLLRQRYKAAMLTAEANPNHWLKHGSEDTQESMSTICDAIAAREAREYAREVQVRHHAAYDLRRRKKKEHSANRRFIRQERSTGITAKLSRHPRVKDRYSRTCSEFAVDWVIPTARHHYNIFVRLCPQ